MWLWNALRKRRLARKAVFDLGYDCDVLEASSQLKEMPAIAVPLLIKSLRYSSAPGDAFPFDAIRRQAALLLGEIGDSQAIEPLSQAMLAYDRSRPLSDGIAPSVGVKALLSLGQAGLDVAVTVLGRLAQALPASAYSYDRQSLAEAMALTRDGRFVPDLEGLLAQEEGQAEPEWEAMCVIARALHECGVDRALMCWVGKFMSRNVSTVARDYAQVQFWRRTAEQLAQVADPAVADRLASHFIATLERLGTAIEWKSKAKPGSPGFGATSGFRSHEDDIKEAARDALIVIRDSQAVVPEPTRAAIEAMLKRVRMKRAPCDEWNNH